MTEPIAAAGHVYLVGAGPGDPGLMTLRGAEVLAHADVVVHDRLTSPALLSMAPSSAERVDVGKQPDDRGDQAAINRLLIDRANSGQRVVRLKGGDPFVFGRGGEEALALLDAGVPFEVVPGVTSAVAAPASAGVPVTHRGLVGCFTVVAGHSRSVDVPVGQGGTNWEGLAAAGGTIVVLMGATHRARIAERLMAGGRAPSTPVVAVHRGTEPGQRVVRTTLATLGDTALSAPVTIVIGEVATLDLTSVSSGPLAGKTIAVTRAAHQAPALSGRLRELGATVLEVAVIELSAPGDGGAALRAAAGRLRAGRYAWAVFTSANGVDRFISAVPDARAFGGTNLAAVGSGTAEALSRFRLLPDLVGTEKGSEGLLEAFPAAPGDKPPGTRARPPAVLLPQAAGARPLLRRGLAAKGWAVDVVDAYTTVPRPVPGEMLDSAGRADAICFASPSAVHSYLDQAAQASAGCPPVVVCIGPVTAAAARSRGVEVAAEATEQTLDGLARALAAALAARGPGPATGPGPRGPKYL